MLHFLLFPQCFQLFQRQISISESQSFCCLQMFSIWIHLKICCFIKRVKQENIYYCSGFIMNNLFNYSNITRIKMIAIYGSWPTTTHLSSISLVSSLYGQHTSKRKMLHRPQCLCSFSRVETMF